MMPATVNGERSKIVFFILVFVFLKTSTGRVAYVSSASGGNATTLLEALRDQQIDVIVLDSNVSVEQSFDPYIGKGVPLNRNVTVTGAAGLDTILNLGFRWSGIRLCSTCTFMFENVTVENERRGTGGLVDFFVGDPGSRVLMNNVYRLRPACTAAEDSAVVVNATKRSVHFPNSDGQQLLSFRDVVYQGRLFPKSLYLTDFTADDPPRAQEGRGALGGYAVRNTNTTRLCRYLVDPSCLEIKSSDACVNDLIDKVLDGSVSDPGPAIPGIAAGAAVAGLVLILTILGLFMWRRLHSQRRLRDQQLPVHGQTFGKSVDDDGLQHTDSPNALDGAWGPRPGGGGRGWEVSSILTAPLIQEGDVANSNIVLGELLGAGSFGRVYKASWAGREVAVKVIEHESSTSSAVENEVQLMLLFNHPNIVRAYHCVSYVRLAASTNLGGGSIEHRSEEAAGTRSTQEGSNSDRETSFYHQQRHSLDIIDSASVMPHNSHLLPYTAANQQVLPSSSAAFSNDSAASMSRSGKSRHVKSLVVPAVAAHVAEGTAVDAQGHQSRPAAAAYESSSANIVNSSNSGGVRHGTNDGVHDGGGGEGAVKGAWGAGASDDGDGGGGWRGADSLHALDIVTTPNRRIETWLVQEYCDCGTLGGIISEWEQSQESQQQMLCRLLLLQDCAQGLKVLHSKNVVHGDLNARNVLVSSDSSSANGLCAKLADLGLSRSIKQHKTHRTTNTVGTMSHMPPELLRYGRMSAAVDIYAFGVMMWEVFTGQPAFKKLHYGQFFETVVLRNLRPMIPAGMPADYQLLMEHCWATEPADRPSIDRILECLRYMIQERQQTAGILSSMSHATAAQTPFRAASTSQSSFTTSIASRIPSLLVRQPQERLMRLNMFNFTADSSNDASVILGNRQELGAAAVNSQELDDAPAGFFAVDSTPRSIDTTASDSIQDSSSGRRVEGEQGGQRCSVTAGDADVGSGQDVAVAIMGCKNDSLSVRCSKQDAAAEIQGPLKDEGSSKGTDELMPPIPDELAISNRWFV